ncbi:MAG: ATP synthase F1 subunit gamma [Candidatus Gottesmanbacteria bacterium]|nr:ATP synthase F1 subunit gamma [Candidatus Gottesmanbacteria bacterium]
MANIRLIKRRIKSAKNIAQITKAMELVAASRMRKAQAVALAGRAYAQKIYEMVAYLASRVDAIHHPLLAGPKKISGWRTIIVLSSNKGLCGGLNTNLFRFLNREYPDMGKHRYVVLGSKAAVFVSRMAGGRVMADFSQTVPFAHNVAAITAMVAEEYTGGKTDGVDLVYNEFLSAIKQNPRKKTILPLTIEGVGESKVKSHLPADATHQALQAGKSKVQDILIEPDPESVFAALLPHYLENQIRDAILQAEASEHSARMVAMRNATDNATGLVGDLTLVYNKARQEKITYEITDMITARLSVVE